MQAELRRVDQLLELLDHAYPKAGTELQHRNCFELLIATILSAQCTDERVNRVTPVLFRRYPTPRDLGQAKLKDVEGIVRATGFYKAKARSVVGCSASIAERFGGRIPRNLDELVDLPGVGRKTANVVLGNCFDTPAIVVDTHVKRVSRRLGLSGHTDPGQIESDLAKILPKPRWTEISHQLLLHGRYTCKAKNPLCLQCPLHELCEAPEKFQALKRSARRI